MTITRDVVIAAMPKAIRCRWTTGFAGMKNVCRLPVTALHPRATQRRRWAGSGGLKYSVDLPAVRPRSPTARAIRSRGGSGGKNQSRLRLMVRPRRPTPTRSSSGSSAVVLMPSSLDRAALYSLASHHDNSAASGVKSAEVTSSSTRKCAQSAGLNVLYCIGESADEVSHWQDVLKAQLTEGLKDTDLSKIAIAYEPIWAIGPGKTPPGRERIQETARFIRSIVDIPVVYGGGLKSDNAEMLASIPEISGGLIALTRFTGDIGFYPDEYLDIVKIYLSNKQ